MTLEKFLHLNIMTLKKCITLKYITTIYRYPYSRVAPKSQKFLPYFELFHERFYIISFIFEKIKDLVT